MSELGGTSALVVGGAGFVGGNLVRELLDARRARACSSSTTCSRPSARTSPTTRASSSSRARSPTTRVLAQLDDEFDYVFHLATYHGNQSSIADPLADHENNLITTLKLFERIKGFERLRKLVYAASGCTLAPHTYGEAEAIDEDGPVPLDLDSPYQISKVVGEFYSVYYHHRHGLADRARALPERLRPGRDPRRRPVARNAGDGVAERDADLRLPRAQGPAASARQRGRASRDFIYVGDIVDGLLRCATAGEPGDVYNLASGVETSIRELAETINRMAGNDAGVELLPARDWDRSGHRFGSTEKARRSSASRPGCRWRTV